MTGGQSWTCLIHMSLSPKATSGHIWLVCKNLDLNQKKKNPLKTTTLKLKICPIWNDWTYSWIFKSHMDNSSVLFCISFIIMSPCLISVSVEFAVWQGVGMEKALVQLNYWQSHYNSGYLTTRYTYIQLFLNISKNIQ